MNIRAHWTLGALLAGAVAVGAWSTPVQAQVDTSAKHDTAGYRAGRADTSGIQSRRGQPVIVIRRWVTGQTDTLRGYQSVTGVVIVEQPGGTSFERDSARWNKRSGKADRSWKSRNQADTLRSRDTIRTRTRQAYPSKPGQANDSSGVKQTMPPLNPGMGGRTPSQVDSLHQVTGDSGRQGTLQSPRAGSPNPPSSDSTSP